MSIKTKKINLGNIELAPLEFEPRNVKVRVTTMVDQDVLIALKKIAKSNGQKYQTLLNQVLRAYLTTNAGKKLSEAGERRIRQIVREELQKRA